MYREGAYFYQPIFPSTLGYEAADIAEAHRYMEANGQVGKIVVTVAHDGATS
ncbi:hypothetical protein [Streptosporangium sp. NPDC003464]